MGGACRVDRSYLPNAPYLIPNIDGMSPKPQGLEANISAEPPCECLCYIHAIYMLPLRARAAMGLALP